jgi:hypothetical protein
MCKQVLLGLVTALVLLAGALPVAAESRTATQVIEIGNCTATVRLLLNGVVQAWTYCEEEGYYPAGTALHLVAVPADRPLSEPWVLKDLSDFPGGELSGVYWVQENAISPAAVIARVESPRAAIAWMLRVSARARAMRLQPPALDASSMAGGAQVTSRQETATRAQQDEGLGDQQQTRNETRVRDETHHSAEHSQIAIQQRTQAQQGATNAHRGGR